jgi:hypothetical protein
MKSKITALLGTLLFISAAINIYLYVEKDHWKEAWLNQFITTSEVENILKLAAEDASIENIKEIAIGEFGEESVHFVDLQGKFNEFGSDNIALGVNETLLLFKGGVYYGSKANLPNH